MSNKLAAAVFNGGDDLSSFLDQFDGLPDDPAIDDANLNDLFPAIWTEEDHSDIDFALKDALISDAGADTDQLRATAASANNQLRSVSPTSVLKNSGSSPDLLKTMLNAAPVQGRARTKRDRQPTADSGDLSRQLVPASWTWTASADDIRKSAVARKTKKLKRPSPNEMHNNQNKYPNSAALMEVGIQRKCTHCEITQTPQWRLGPLGPKTLCNACGVRYKSGRLFPEYRPAASPTFSPSKHSNSHRKVIEMRKNNGKSAPGADALKAAEGAESQLVPVSIAQIGAGFSWA